MLRTFQMTLVATKGLGQWDYPLHIYQLRGHMLLVINDIVFIFLKANSVDPDEMPCYVAFHLHLHFLSNYARSI